MTSQDSGFAGGLSIKKAESYYYNSPTTFIGHLKVFCGGWILLLPVLKFLFIKTNSGMHWQKNIKRVSEKLICTQKGQVNDMMGQNSPVTKG